MYACDGEAESEGTGRGSVEEEGKAGVLDVSGEEVTGVASAAVFFSLSLCSCPRTYLI